jgi:hypothetical protein
MPKLLTVGKHKITGEPVFIENAQNGLKCDAVCPSCDQDLEARQGNSNDWSFAHDNSGTTLPPCSASYESALHLTAKWIISRGTRIKLPNRKYFDYDQATVEKWVDRFRIDVYLFNTTTNRSLLVEVIVYNPLDREKIEGLRQLDHQILEINLSAHDGPLTEGPMAFLLLDTTHGKTLHKRRVSYPTVSLPTFNPLPAILFVLAFILGMWFLSKPKRQ